MTTNVISVMEGDNLKNVFKLMEEHGIVGLPVLNQEQAVVGIVTQSDLIKHFTTLKTPLGVNILGSIVYLDNLEDWSENLKDHCAELVKDIMTTDVITVMETQPLRQAIDLMAKHQINRLPVVNEQGLLVGIVTRKDIVHQLAQLTTI